MIPEPGTPHLRALGTAIKKPKLILRRVENSPLTKLAVNGTAQLRYYSMPISCK